NQFAGYVSISRGLAPPVKLFFWVVMSDKDPRKDPVVLWMNGGPGSSSLYGLFVQWGPYRIDYPHERSKVTFRKNDYPMTKKMTWVFLEQPSGTGFSTGGPNVQDSDTAAKDISSFITALLQPTTTFKMADGDLSLNGRELHIAGESFGGHWLPALGSYMVSIGQHTAVNLSSFILGNSLIDVSLMGDAIYQLLCGPSPLKLPNANQLAVDMRCRRDMPTWKRNCDPAIVTCQNHPNPTNCNAAYAACAQSWGEGWSGRFHRDVYDVSRTEKENTDSNNFYSQKWAVFMNKPDRKTRFGVTPGPKRNPDSDAMIGRYSDSGDWMKSYIPNLENILKAKIDFLLYAVSAPLIAKHD
ncbi:Alpha/Beta hydrolase protein, partial [Rhexocercosporidium sp. MPI-PUGE-AT-0058]